MTDSTTDTTARSDRIRAIQIKRAWSSCSTFRKMLIIWLALIVAFYVSAAILSLFGLAFRNKPFLLLGVASPVLFGIIAGGGAVVHLIKTAKVSLSNGAKAPAVTRLFLAIALCVGVGVAALGAAFAGLFMVEEEYVVERGGEQQLAVVNQWLAARVDIDYYAYHGIVFRGSESLQHYEGNPNRGAAAQELSNLRNL